MRAVFRYSPPFFPKKLQQIITFNTELFVLQETHLPLLISNSEGIWSIFSVPVDSEKDSAASKTFNLLQSWLDAFVNDRVA